MCYKVTTTPVYTEVKMTDVFDPLQVLHPQAVGAVEMQEKTPTHRQLSCGWREGGKGEREGGIIRLRALKDCTNRPAELNIQRIVFNRETGTGTRPKWQEEEVWSGVPGKSIPPQARHPGKAGAT